MPRTGRPPEKLSLLMNATALLDDAKHAVRSVTRAFDPEAGVVVDSVSAFRRSIAELREHLELPQETEFIVIIKASVPVAKAVARRFSHNLNGHQQAVIFSECNWVDGSRRVDRLVVEKVEAVA